MNWKETILTKIGGIKKVSMRSLLYPFISFVFIGAILLLGIKGVSFLSHEVNRSFVDTKQLEEKLLKLDLENFAVIDKKLNLTPPASETVTTATSTEEE
ncbi:MAG: hypothetical protein BMS9Abin13_097 [Patescibacteria group bacterium]|nr:MAG: hypothetical protein BMS9Abin13_097 [Patescibacteria group bacterium]